MVTLNKVFKLGFTGAKTKKVGGGVAFATQNIWVKSFPSRRNNQCKGPETEMCPGCSANSKA